MYNSWSSFSGEGMKNLREIEIEHGYEAKLLWPPYSKLNKVSEKILFREVNPQLDCAYLECEKALSDRLCECEPSEICGRCKALAALKKARE